MEGAMAVAQRMVDAVQALGLEHESSPIAKVVTISAGVFSQVPTGAGAKLLVREADEALYRAKSAGRNGVMGSAQQLPVHAQA
jgi:diguanylate cyclase (GGDEF)-like protein